MANKNSFLDNAVSYFDQIMQQEYISKSEIISLKKKLHKLSDSDESYKKLYRRITTISNAKRITGKNEANVLQEFYEEFQVEILKHKKIEILPEKVWTTEDHKGIPKGSCIYVKEQTDLNYRGTWSFMGGTRPVIVPKKICSETSELQQTMKQMEEYFKSRK